MAPPRPRVHSLAIELTTECNQQCRHCYNQPRARSLTERAPGGSDEDPARTVARVRRLLDAWQLERVTLPGGEPLGAAALWDVLALARDRGVPAQLISNGGLVTPRIAERLHALDVRAVQVTLNGPNAELHGEHTGDPRHFELALGGVRTLAAHGIPVVGCIVVTHLNAASIGATVELWRSLGVHQLALSRFSPAGRALAHAARLLPTRDDVIEAFGQARPYAAGLDMRISSTMPIPPCMMETADVAPIGFGTCAIGTPLQELALGPDGSLRNCTLHRQAIGGVADVLDPAVDLAALLQADEVTGYARRHPEFCAGCLHALGCGGGCGAAADSMLGGGPRRMPDPFLWQHIDDALARRLGRAPATEEPP